MKNLIFLFAFIAAPYFLFCQDLTDSGKKVKSYVSSDYNRNAITFIGLNFGEKFSSDVYQKLEEQEVQDKFYDNLIAGSILKPGVERKSVSNEINMLDEAQIVKWLNQNKVGQQILSIWFNRQSDGSFNVEVLKERGLFNANDNDYIVASSSKRGESSLMDMGLQLVNQSYLIAFDYQDIMDMTEYYDSNKVVAEKRIMNGFKSSLKTYLFKLDFNEEIAAVFFQDYWVSESDPNKQEKVEAFEKAEFPFTFLSKQQNEISATQYNQGHTLAPKVQKSKEELFVQMNKTAIESVINDIEKQNETFRVKAMVSDVKPISAKIGKKEGLKFDQRYFVYENRTRRSGDVFSKRVGVVKSMKVIDNRQVTIGQTEPSSFYQIAGGKVDNFGMFLEQQNDVGLNVFLGNTVGGMPGFTGRLEYFISKAFGEMVGSGTGKGLTAWKLYLEGAYGEDSYGINLDENYVFARGSVGVAKDFYPLNFLHWGPFVGYGFESANTESSDNVISTDFIEMGARVGINLAHNFQLIGSANYYMMVSSEMLDSNKEVIDEEFDYKAKFDDRFGPGFSLGIRIMF